MAVFLDDDAFEPSLKKVAGSIAPFVKKLSVDAVQLPHAKGKIAIGCFNQEMVVVGHKAIRVAQPVITLVDVLKGVEEVHAVLVVLKDGLLFVAARRNVVNGSWVFYAKRSSHCENVA
jgi:hypothetical protein